jgi:hypothetical protein
MEWLSRDRLDTGGRLQRPYQDGRTRLTHNVQAPVQNVASIDISMSRRPERDGVAGRSPGEAVGGWIVAIIGFGFDNDPSRSIDEQRGAEHIPCNVLYIPRDKATE